MRISIDCRYIRQRPSGIGTYKQALVDRLPAMAPDESMASAFSVVRYLPMPSKSSSPKPMGSMEAWHAAQVWLSVCAATRCRVVAFGSRGGGLTFTSGGGGGISLQSRRVHTSLPRRMGDVSSLCE